MNLSDITATYLGDKDGNRTLLFIMWGNLSSDTFSHLLNYSREYYTPEKELVRFPLNWYIDKNIDCP